MRVHSAGVSLEVHEHSSWTRGRPSVLLVHGYPDQQQVWDRLLDALPRDQLHLVLADPEAEDHRHAALVHLEQVLRALQELGHGETP